MTDSFVTRCPHCRTRLRVSDEQIRVAGGLVRCGTCLQTFDALEHLQNGRPRADSAEMDGMLIHDGLDLDDLGLDDLNLDEELAQIEAQEQAFSKELLSLSQQIQGEDKTRSKPSEDDEAWAEALLREEEGQADSEEDDAPDYLGHAEHPEPPQALSLRKKEQEGRALTLDPLEDEVPSASALWLPQKPSRDAQGGEAAKPAEPLLLRADPADFRKSPLRRPLLEEDEDLAAPFEEEEKTPFAGERLSPARKQLLWVSGCLLALLLLFGQYLFFRFDALSQQPSYRPLLGGLCSVIGCTLPGRSDIRQIRSSNLVVHSHPELAGALVVDVILYNSAAFAQPFPLLELEFSNLAGRPIAKRRFTPLQYLAGEMQGKLQMPPQIPIHIALEIADPGAEAVNYSLSVLPAP